MKQTMLFENSDIRFTTEELEHNLISSKLASLSEKGKLTFNKEEIRNLLYFYKDEFIYLKQFDIIDKKFYFTFRKFNYPYLKFEVRHLTREQTVIFITQAAYLGGIVYYLYEDNWNFSLNKFYEDVANERLGFTDVNINYKQYEENKENTQLIFTSIVYRKFKNRIYGKVDFQFERHCTGSIKFFVDS